MNNLAVKLSGLFLVLVSFGCASGVPQRADASADFLPIVPVVEQEQPQVTGQSLTTTVRVVVLDTNKTIGLATF